MRKIALGVLIGGLAAAGGWLATARQGAFLPPIPVGVLHSLTGSMALSEPAVVDGTLLVLEELNRAGGVLGRPVRPVVACKFTRNGVATLEVSRTPTDGGDWVASRPTRSWPRFRLSCSRSSTSGTWATRSGPRSS